MILNRAFDFWSTAKVLYIFYDARWILAWKKGLYNKPCFPIFQNFGLDIGFFYVSLLFLLCLQVWVETGLEFI